jgi:hypothetical protein
MVAGYGYFSPRVVGATRKSERSGLGGDDGGGHERRGIVADRWEGIAAREDRVSGSGRGRARCIAGK